MGLLDILGLGSKPDNISEYAANGALIIDVRTTGEFASGHIKGSKKRAVGQYRHESFRNQKMEQTGNCLLPFGHAQCTGCRYFKTKRY